jgi:SAM-dependent methyltransferase
MMDYLEKNYTMQESWFYNDLTDPERIKISKSWFDESTADYWRHIRAFECVDCIRDDINSSWLTIGDGRWGLDSLRIKKKGFINAIPSDISEALLKKSKEMGYINNYHVENCEKLSFSDKSFDYVFCKESFHHFPRPYKALYEMLRVARKGVFLIEPNDTIWGLKSIDGRVSLSSKRFIFNFILGIILRLLRIKNHPVKGKTFNYPIWEDVGNFCYKISPHEAEKIALGMNLPQLVVKGLNDSYIKGCEFEPADIKRSDIFKKIFYSIKKMDKLCSDGIADYNMIMIGFFVENMNNLSRSEFLKRNWNVIDLPKNPYIKEEK